MNNTAKLISTYFLKVDIIAKDRYDWCVYTVQKRLSQFSTITIYLTVSILYFDIFEASLIAVTLRIFRRCTGGYHTKNPFVCLLLTIIIMILGIQFSSVVLDSNFVLAVILYIISILVLLKLAPVNHPNMHFSQKEYVANKLKIAQLIKLSIPIILISLTIKPNYAFILVTAILIDSASVLIAKILKQEISIVKIY